MVGVPVHVPFVVVSVDVTWGVPLMTGTTVLTGATGAVTPSMAPRPTIYPNRDCQSILSEATDADARNVGSCRNLPRPRNRIHPKRNKKWNQIADTGCPAGKHRDRC